MVNLNPSVRLGPSSMHSPRDSTALHEPDGHCSSMAELIALRAVVAATPQPLPRPVRTAVCVVGVQVHTGGQVVITPLQVSVPPTTEQGSEHVNTWPLGQSSSQPVIACCTSPTGSAAADGSASGDTPSSIVLQPVTHNRAVVAVMIRGHHLFVISSIQG